MPCAGKRAAGEIDAQRVGEGREGPQGEISVTYLERALSFSSRANVWPNQTPSLEFPHDYVSQMVAAAYNDLQSLTLQR